MNWQPIDTAPKVGYFDHAHGWVDGECIAPVAGPDYWRELEPPK